MRECVGGGRGCGPFGAGMPAQCYGDGCYGDGCYGNGKCQSGCLQNSLGWLLDCPEGCQACDSNYNFTPGPPTGQVAYPYYTVRGPRDFLHPNPPTIGPR